MGAMMRAINWAQTPVGPVSGWSQPLRSMVGLVLRNRFPLCMWWGPELVQFYNDPFVPILGSKHPVAMGQSGNACWSEIWPTIGPMIEGPFAWGRGANPCHSRAASSTLASASGIQTIRFASNTSAARCAIRSTMVN